MIFGVDSHRLLYALDLCAQRRHDLQSSPATLGGGGGGGVEDVEGVEGVTGVAGVGVR